MDIYKEVIKALTPYLKQMGFSKVGSSFYLKLDKNYGVLNFQKSKESTKDVVKFTINFGIYSDVLGILQYDYDSSTKPKVEQCHWEARVGSFMPGCPDYWWEVKVTDDISRTINNVLESVRNIVIPEINKRLSDDGLIYSWLNDSYAGTTEIGRFKYLTILLKAKGDFNNLNRHVETFIQQVKGKPNESRALAHLMEIGYSK